jgi:two-component system, OmpR family, sensor histidine kinase CpxA
MRSLFGKIFLSFWIAQALFIVLAILVTWIVRQQGETRLDSAESRIFNEAIQIYEQSGTQAVSKYLDEVRDTQHIRTFLFDSQGNEISNQRPPDWVRDNTRPRLASRGIWRWIPPFRVQRQNMTSASGHRYTMVAIQPAPGPFGPHAPTGGGILIGIVSSGLVCYLLARYLTAPVVRLQTATQKLSAGDLSARAGPEGSRRKDEIAQLVRDFDTMAERLEKLVNAQSRLLNDISHELRSPLARMNVALALARQRAGPEAQSMLDRIDAESDRLNELIERLLTIARLEAAPEGIRMEPVHLAELVKEIVEDADFEAQSRNCRVVANTVQDLIVSGNPALMHSAIENVVRNATQHTREGTEVQVTVEHEERGGDSEAVVRVSDSGPGVAEESLEKLFRPFYRTDDARVRHTGGVGLGLAITDRAVRLHGGSVRAVNRPVGGLLVEIRLPLLHSGAKARPSVPVMEKDHAVSRS